MNLARYEQIGQALYSDFAAIVKVIVEEMIASVDLPGPQSIQCRSKNPASLKVKLELRSIADSDAIEEHIKDLAGARLIFYTNTDVDRFLNSGLIQNGFEVDWKETRIHHPISENSDRRYQGIHFTVRLSGGRVPRWQSMGDSKVCDAKSRSRRYSTMPGPRPNTTSFIRGLGLRASGRKRFSPSRSGWRA